MRYDHLFCENENISQRAGFYLFLSLLFNLVYEYAQECRKFKSQTNRAYDDKEKRKLRLGDVIPSWMFEAAKVD